MEQNEMLVKLFNEYDPQYNQSYLGPQVNNIFELGYSFDPEIMSYEVAFVSEIDQMLNEKITPEEIFKCI